jgi:primosomal protein N' (replication factor Y)
MRYCKIALTNSLQTFSDRHSGTNSTANYGLLSYSIPEEICEEIAVGSMVLVPFRNHKENGLVIDIYKSSPEEHDFKVRDILEPIFSEEFVSKELVQLIKFTAEYYACSYSEVCNAVFPKSIFKKPDKTIRLLNLKIQEDNLVLNTLLQARKNQTKWQRLKTLTGLSESELKKEITKLKKRNLIAIEYSKSTSRKSKTCNPMHDLSVEKEISDFKFTQEQEAVIKEFARYEGSHKFMLHGVTGSGKTEVYMHEMEKVLKSGKSCIFLVPEIALAPQLSERLAKKFGEDKLFIWHSALAQSEKKFTFTAMLDDEPKIIIGARSAIFTPVKNLGLIILDEEHENSYKQEEPNPRYHTHNVAIKRAELNNCPIIFGSATPSVELYYKARSDDFKDYHLLELQNRVFDTLLPEVKIIDMRDEFNSANKSVFARALKANIEEALKLKEKVILFLNKRGTASHVFCRNCGFVYNCSNCESKTVYHQDKKKLICHYCGYNESHPTECPNCNAATIKFFGLGTQKLEEETIKAFPEAKVARLDSDNARIDNNYLKVWRDFKDGNIDILIGTQMIAKGLDLANLNLVGVISADTNLSQLDYKADERAFQLLTQVAGRAGRRQKRGQVVFQSYQPENETLLFAQKHDYKAFYEKEILIRQELKYPPFATMIRMRSIDESELAAIETINNLHREIFKVLDQFGIDVGVINQVDKEKTNLLKMMYSKKVSIMGPCPSLISRMNNKFRYHIVLKISQSNESDDFIKAIKLMFMNLDKQKASITIDIDNVSLY